MGRRQAQRVGAKKLITDKEASYEYKGVTIFDGPNHVGLVLAGNDKWIVPASMDERRFCASKVSGAHFAPPGELITPIVCIGTNSILN